MRKRLLCVVLTLALLFSAQSAAAAAGAGNTRSTIVTANMKLPTINVVVPSTGEVIINPYGLGASVNGEYLSNQIMCTPCYIANKSDIALDVSVRVTTTINAGSDMTLASSSRWGVDSTKEAFIYFEMQSVDTDDPSDTVWDSAYDSAKHVVLDTSSGGVSKQSMLTLAAGDANGNVAERGGYAAFRLTGDAVLTPRGSSWNEDDGLTVGIAFTFDPIPYS